MLGYGTMVAKFCAENPTCSAELVRVWLMLLFSISQLNFNISDLNRKYNFFCAFLPQPIHELVVKAVTANDVGKLVLALKVLGNAGHPASLKTIMKLLPTFGSGAAALPVRVHVDAILALRNIAKKEPRMVRLKSFIPFLLSA